MYEVEKMSLEETKENLDLRKRTFEYENKNSYGIENLNYMTHKHNNKVKNIAECNLIHETSITPNALKD